MFARWSAFIVWALVAAGAVTWGLKLLARPLPAPAHTQLAAPAAAAGGDWARLFGAAPPPPASAAAEAAAPAAPESARFRLVGVVAPVTAARSQGLALIAVDGRMARAFRVGAVIDGEQVLQSVHPRGAAIGPRRGPPTVTLELQPLPPPATGVPPSVAGALPVPPPGLPLPQPMVQVPDPAQADGGGNLPGRLLQR